MKKTGVAVLCAFALCLFATFVSASEIPEWVTNTKLKGDFRFRFQNEDNVFDDDDNEVDRNRFRLRWRFGVESQPNDQWVVGFGLASGGDDPRSTNETLDNFFETPDARLDYAYTTFTPIENIELTLGKFDNPIWNPKDLIWDSDIMPEGIAAGLTFDVADSVGLFLTPAFFILDEENPDEDDPNMWAIQAGLKMNVDKTASGRIGATYYKLNNVEDIEFFNGEEDTSAWSLDAEAGLETLPVYIGIFGQYVVSDADDDDTGYLMGAVVGDKKIKKLGDWQVKYNYRKLEMNAWWDQLPDSDFMGGDTGVKGSEVELAVGLHKNVTLGLDYYKGEEIDGDADQDLIQLDLVVKFP